MLNSTILDLAIGLVFTFLAMGLAVSAIVEAVASAPNGDPLCLLQGVKDLLNGGMRDTLFVHRRPLFEMIRLPLRAETQSPACRPG
jgi:hypothetical protein